MSKKRLGSFVFLLASILISAQCNRQEEPAEIHLFALQLDKPHITFPSEGGTETVTAFIDDNSTVSAIGGIKYGVEFLFADGVWEEGEYTYSTDSQYGALDLLDGGWFHAMIPRNGYSNELIITVDENLTGHPRRVQIHIGAVYVGIITIDQL